MSRVLPILFNTDMVRAILDGRKTVTRRVIKQNKINDILSSPIRKKYPEYPDEKFINCLIDAPYNKGDILYIQETWKIHALNPGYCMMIRYKADNFCNIQVKFPPSRFEKFKKFYEKNGWQSPYFMPKEGARIWLKVTDVRPDRLHNMTGQDILKEGVNSQVHPDADYFDANQKELFAQLWNSTIQKRQQDLYSWDANPWVWAISFEQCKKPESEDMQE